MIRFKRYSVLRAIDEVHRRTRTLPDVKFTISTQLLREAEKTMEQSLVEARLHEVMSATVKAVDKEIVREALAEAVERELFAICMGKS